MKRSPETISGRSIVDDLGRIQPEAARMVAFGLHHIAAEIRKEVDRTTLPNPRADEVARLAADLVDPGEIGVRPTTGLGTRVVRVPAEVVAGAGDDRDLPPADR